MKRLQVPISVTALAAVALCSLLMLAVAQAFRPAMAGSQTRTPPIQGSDVDNVPRVKLEDFKKLLSADAIVVIDVRDVDAYREGHIPGALSVPIASVGDRAGEFRNTKKPIVTYCS